MPAADQPSTRRSLRRRLRNAAIASAAALAVAGGAVVGLQATGRLPADLLGSEPSPTPSVSTIPPHRSAQPVLGTTTPVVGAAFPTAQLQRLLSDPALGPAPGALVLDAATGAALFEKDSTTPRTPASVAKLATTAAALTAIGPEARLTTRVVAGSTADDIVLVGGGDPMLTMKRPRPRDYPHQASLEALADATVTALKARQASSPSAGASGPPPSAPASPSTSASPAALTVRLHVDDTLFSGPAVSPDWPASYVGSGVVAPVSALSVDGARLSARSNERAADPAVSAGAAFARLLTARGVTVQGGVTRATAPVGAAALAEVTSPTLAEMVETDLTTSDNDIAEALLRHVAIARDRPATFADGTAAVADVLTELGVPTDGLDLLDGSGLARGSRVPPETLARLLVLATAADHPGLRSIVTSLPVAGFSGTLADRFDSGTTDDGAGLVRAKTGTLTGVSTLAGVTTQAGRPVVFVVMADRVPPTGTLAARAALDRVAAALTDQPPAG